MKKNKLLIILFLLVIFLLIISNIYFYLKINTYKTNEENEKKNLEAIELERQNLLEAENQKKLEKEEFLKQNVDNNTIPIGLYTIQNGKKVLTSEYYCNWDAENVFAIFYALPTNEKQVSNYDFKSLFNEYWNKNENSENYKIGYSIKYGLDNGEDFSKLILNPTDAETLFSKLQCYLYDDITYMPGRTYYHMREYEMTDETMLTSLKLVGDKETPCINGPIELTVFTYDGEEDLDRENNKYLGKNTFTTKIYRQRQ